MTDDAPMAKPWNDEAVATLIGLVPSHPAVIAFYKDYDVNDHRPVVDREGFIIAWADMTDSLNWEDDWYIPEDDAEGCIYRLRDTGKDVLEEQLSNMRRTLLQMAKQMPAWSAISDLENAECDLCKIVRMLRAGTDYAMMDTDCILEKYEEATLKQDQKGE
jgi:hypothetical protein